MDMHLALTGFFFYLRIAAAVTLYPLERGMAPIDPNGPVMLFDLDHTLYPRSGTNGNYRSSIITYLQQYAGLSKTQANMLYKKYRHDYDAVVVKGLVADLGIDPVHLEEFVDQRSNLQKTLRPNLQLKKLINDIRVPRFIFTNAGLNHALKVLQLLGLDRSFHGIVYVDYSVPNFASKPERSSYVQAMMAIGCYNPSSIWFVDDTQSYVLGAAKLGWNAVHYDESGTLPRTGSIIARINNLYELCALIPEFFK